MNKAFIEEAVAEDLKSEDVSLNDKSKLPATVENLEGSKASSQFPIENNQIGRSARRGHNTN